MVAKADPRLRELIFEARCNNDAQPRNQGITQPMDNLFLTISVQPHEPAEQQREPGTAPDASPGHPPATAVGGSRLAVEHQGELAGGRGSEGLTQDCEDKQSGCEPYQIG